MRPARRYRQSDRTEKRSSTATRIGWHRIRTALAAVLGIPFDSVSGNLSGQGERNCGDRGCDRHCCLIGGRGLMTERSISGSLVVHTASTLRAVSRRVLAAVPRFEM